MRILTLVSLSATLSFASYSNLTLQKALDTLAKNNLELKVASFDKEIKEFESDLAKSMKYGRLDLQVNALNSNDAGNVFGFKMQSREASFLDFGFDEFLAPMAQTLEAMNAQTLQQGFTQEMGSLLEVEPKELNYPDARNHFQEKLTYQLPIYTGGMLTQYEKITSALVRMSRLDKEKLTLQKRYELKKVFFDISLVESFIKNLEKMSDNLDKLKATVYSMIDEGYAIPLDGLQVDVEKSNVERMLNQAKLNKDLAYKYISFLLDDKVESIFVECQLAPVPIIKDEKGTVDGNVDIKRATLGHDITKMAVRLEQASYLPTLGAFGEYGSADDSFLGDFSDHDAYTVGMQLNWNITDFGGTSAKVQAAKVNNLKAKTQLALAKKGIALQISKILSEIKSKDFDIQSLEKKHELSQRVYENFKEKYREGIVSMSDLLMKNSFMIQSLLELRENKNARNDKVFALEKLIAKGK